MRLRFCRLTVIVMLTKRQFTRVIYCNVPHDLSTASLVLVAYQKSKSSQLLFQCMLLCTHLVCIRTKCELLFSFFYSYKLHVKSTITSSFFRRNQFYLSSVRLFTLILLSVLFSLLRRVVFILEVDCGCSVVVLFRD